MQGKHSTSNSACRALSLQHRTQGKRRAVALNKTSTRRPRRRRHVRRSPLAPMHAADAGAQRGPATGSKHTRRNKVLPRWLAAGVPLEDAVKDPRPVLRCHSACRDPSRAWCGWPGGWCGGCEVGTVRRRAGDGVAAKRAEWRGGAGGVSLPGYGAGGMVGWWGGLLLCGDSCWCQRGGCMTLHCAALCCAVEAVGAVEADGAKGLWVCVRVGERAHIQMIVFANDGSIHVVHWRWRG